MAATDRTTGSEFAEQSERSLKIREQLFRCFELGCVDTSSCTAMLNRKAQVKHLVVHHVLDRKFRNFRAVEITADHDGVMTRIIVPEIRTRRTDCPAEVRPGHQSPEVPDVQVFENVAQVPADAFGRTDLFATALPPQTLQIGADIATVQVEAIPMGARAGHRLPPQL